MKKVLFVATVTKHINAFHIPYLKWFKEQGYEVHVASNGNEKIEYCDKHYDLPFERFPIKKNNLKTYKELKKIIDDNSYEIVHCHTPVGGVLTRLAARKARKDGTRVIYTAHGFHFYKGAPILNWILFYPVEWYLAKYTDILITINKEDFKRAKDRFKNRCKDINYVPGVGIDITKFNIKMSDDEKRKLRKSLGLKKEDFVLTCVARLDKNKNQSFLINCMEQLIKQHSNIHLLLAGSDELNGHYQRIAKDKKLDNNIHFLGNRNDIPQILKISNVAVSSSKREGLPVNILETFASGNSVVALNCRGMKDLIKDGENGFVIETEKEFCNKIEELYDNLSLDLKIKSNNMQTIHKYSLNEILNSMKKIYFGKENMKRIVITRSNYVDPDSRVEKEANSLVNNGFVVQLLTWNRSENYLIKKDLKKLSDCEVERISFGAKAKFGNGIKSLIPFIKFQISLFIWLIVNRKEYDICHFCDFDTAYTGSIACRMLKKKYVFDIFDYLSTNPKNIFQKFIEKKENNIINKSDATIICTEDRVKQIEKASPQKLIIIHNSPNGNKLRNTAENKVVNNKVKIVYVGIFQDYRLLKEMVEAICGMPNIELHIGGFGKYEKYILEMSQKYKNIIYYGKISYEDTLKLESSCNIMTAIYDPKIGNHIYAAPNKFYEALFLGKPLIMVKGTGMSTIVENEKIGVTIDYSKESFIAGLNNLISMSNEWNAIGNKMKNIYDKYFSWKTMELKLIDMYNQLTKEEKNEKNINSK